MIHVCQVIYSAIFSSIKSLITKDMRPILQPQTRSSNIQFHKEQVQFRKRNATEVAGDNAVLSIMPQPMAESQRVLIIFRDGLIVLWGLEESKGILLMGGNMLSLCNETKKVTSSCWACPFGSKVIVGYSNGEV
ncbi:hypothetical protein IFM89_002754 [Coptis chinensis]|uniref:Uncharacterized protein n=1 Tax=Coptis chinensis TaxID=261450 RepID=A0A835HRF0_9MAGN|nr:hypothetical protein IFM89_002754 [Coptis chinensis]